MTSLEQFDRPLVMIGCGNMAGAMLSRWLECGLRGEQVIVVDPGRKELSGDVTLLPGLPGHLPDGAMVILGIKPQGLPDLAAQLSPLLKQGMTVISMLAGVTVESLQAALGDAAALVRIMPNTPVALGKGVCALYAGPSADIDQRKLATTLLTPLGVVEWLEQEDQFNLVTALTGCGPAFLFRFTDALARAACELGMDDAQALRFSVALVEGAAALAASAKEDPATLADRVASKGGMTREGLDVLDKDDRLVRLMTETLRAARDRGEALNKLS